NYRIGADRFLNRDCVFALDLESILLSRPLQKAFSTASTPCRHERVEAIAVSLGLDTCELDYLAPLLGFISNELGELGGRARKRHSPQVSKPSLKIGVGKARIDLSVKPMHDLRRRVLGRPDAIHHNRLVALHEIANGR